MTVAPRLFQPDELFAWHMQPFLCDHVPHVGTGTKCIMIFTAEFQVVLQYLKAIASSGQNVCP